MLAKAKGKVHIAGAKASGAAKKMKNTVLRKHKEPRDAGVSRDLAPEQMAALTDQPQEHHGMLDTMKEKVHDAKEKMSDAAETVKDTVLRREHKQQPESHESADEDGAKPRDMSIEEIAALAGEPVPPHADAQPAHTAINEITEEEDLMQREPEQFIARKVEAHAILSIQRAARGHVFSSDFRPNVSKGTGSAIETDGAGSSYTQRIKDAADVVKNQVAAAADAVKHAVWAAPSHPQGSGSEPGALPGGMTVDEDKSSAEGFVLNKNASSQSAAATYGPGPGLTTAPSGAGHVSSDSEPSASSERQAPPSAPSASGEGQAPPSVPSGAAGPLNEREREAESGPQGLSYTERVKEAVGAIQAHAVAAAEAIKLAVWVPSQSAFQGDTPPSLSQSALQGDAPPAHPPVDVPRMPHPASGEGGTVPDGSIISPVTGRVIAPGGVLLPAVVVPAVFLPDATENPRGNAREAHKTRDKAGAQQAWGLACQAVTGAGMTAETGMETAERGLLTADGHPDAIVKSPGSVSKSPLSVPAVASPLEAAPVSSTGGVAQRVEEVETEGAGWAGEAAGALQEKVAAAAGVVEGTMVEAVLPAAEAVRDKVKDTVLPAVGVVMEMVGGLRPSGAGELPGEPLAGEELPDAMPMDGMPTPLDIGMVKAVVSGRESVATAILETGSATLEMDAASRPRCQLDMGAASLDMGPPRVPSASMDSQVGSEIAGWPAAPAERARLRHAGAGFSGGSVEVRQNSDPGLGSQETRPESVPGVWALPLEVPATSAKAVDPHGQVGQAGGPSMDVGADVALATAAPPVLQVIGQQAGAPGVWALPVGTTVVEERPGTPTAVEKQMVVEEQPGVQSVEEGADMHAQEGVVDSHVEEGQATPGWHTVDLGRLGMQSVEKQPLAQSTGGQPTASGVEVLSGILMAKGQPGLQTAEVPGGTPGGEGGSGVQGGEGLLGGHLGEKPPGRWATQATQVASGMPTVVSAREGTDVLSGMLMAAPP
eukprot:jgi/Mesvir1/27762/Mv07448-RA.1